MARAVRFTKAEREEIAAGLEWRAKLTINRPGRGPEPTPRVKHALSALEKLKQSEEPTEKRTGISVADALAAFREALGPRLVPPPSNAAGMYAQMAKRLAALGLSKLDCISVAKAAGAQWRGSIKAVSLVNQAETLLHDAQLTIPGTTEASAGYESAELEDL